MKSWKTPRRRKTAERTFFLKELGILVWENIWVFLIDEYSDDCIMCKKKKKTTTRETVWLAFVNKLNRYSRL